MVIFVEQGGLFGAEYRKGSWLRFFKGFEKKFRKD
jgi:hypothetical protein